VRPATSVGLAALSAEEKAFLSAPASDAPAFAARLGAALAATLSARLRLPVTLTPQAAVPEGTSSSPQWQVDAALSTLWFARRLGSRAAGGAVPFVPHGLLTTLDAVLAERWLDRREETPVALAWTLRADGCAARLGLKLPADARDMVRWAQETITK
jgi:hypothetical protein